MPRPRGSPRKCRTSAPDANETDSQMKRLTNVAAVVPVFDPEPALPKLCEELSRVFGTVVVVDDGSVNSIERFAMLPKGVVVLKHSRNMGKGRAIKTALGWLDGKAAGAVFVDGDGQHDPGDAAGVAASMLENGCVTLGSRDLSGNGVPAASRIGNACMSFFLRLFAGAKVSDTQTGLRAIPARLFVDLAKVRGEKFEYEMNMLAALHLAGEPICETPVRTIYPDEGRVSHHRPFRDSVRIWFSLAWFSLCRRLRARGAA